MFPQAGRLTVLTTDVVAAAPAVVIATVATGVVVDGVGVTVTSVTMDEEGVVLGVACGISSFVSELPTRG